MSVFVRFTTTPPLSLTNTPTLLFCIYTPGDRLNDGETISVTTDLVNGHTHNLVFDLDKSDPSSWQFRILTCDSLATCWDNHSNVLTMNEEFRIKLGLQDSLGK